MTSRVHVAEKVAPNAGDLVESLRDFGYTLPSALADLIDNSLTASADRIDVSLRAQSEESYLAVVDNGCGMNRTTLVEAMRMGARGPLVARSTSDLGRFGLGLKTASLSQGRRLTVITKTKNTGAPLIRRWDIRHIRARGWQLLKDATPIAQPFVARVQKMAHGTAVVVEDLDRATFLKVSPAEITEHLGRLLQTVREHLEMVFHRFIADGVQITLGSTVLRPWDPFLTNQSTRLAEEKLQLDGHSIEVSPFVLPHHSKLTDEEHDRAAGPNGWNAHQGFYIYRSRRLIVPGTWLNLNLRKEEHFKLARICVDLPTCVDSHWQLNVMKSHVAAPAVLRDDFQRIARDVRREAATVYRYRGERVTPTNAPPQRFVWRREETKAGVRYRIDRTHPVVQALLHDGCGHDRLLDQVLALIEETVPVVSMLQEPARAIDGGVHPLAPAGLERYVEMVVHAEQFLIRAGHAPPEARNVLLAAEPFIHHREELLRRLDRPGQACGGAR